MWNRVGSILRVSYDTKDCLVLDSTCFAVGKHIKFLVGILNSKFGSYLLQNSPKTGTGDLLISVQAIETIKIPIPDNNIECDFENLISKILDGNISLESEIDQKVYKLYGLSKDEIDFIEQQ